MMGKIEPLQVFTSQGHAGVLTEESRHVFNYETTSAAQAVSLLMPLRAESYAGDSIPAPFLQNRPEGYLLQALEHRFAKAGGLTDMQMLAYSSTQIGRLHFNHAGKQKKPTPPKIGKQALLKESATTELFEFLVDTYLLDSFVAGVQPKVMIPDQDKSSATQRPSPLPSLIVKAAGINYLGLTQNEFLCMTAAQKAGLPVAPFWLSDDGKLFVTERFDLQDGQPIGFEDFAVLMGRTGRTDSKYTGSYETLAKAVGAFCPEPENSLDGTQRLFAYIALSVLVRNGDAHLKNFGLTYTHPADRASIRLAPLYDVVTTSMYNLQSRDTGPAVYDRQLALKLAGTKAYPGRTELLQFGRVHCHVAHPERVIERLCDAMQDTLEQERCRIENTDQLRVLKKEWAAGIQSLQMTRLAIPR
ncbi:type II toxin-antitoxin system HipA family toxin [Laribacter hongkongensis]|nr:type II toxin-antitoxin system HipA family toxin [Laribacter hongkongensis]MCG9042106.1 type II toxin-antitoxin system HipA family toxin [Laribacter hongkongensis]MCG9068550.1 type II toxin-antitoxin system HipA family toxin [Laribacter hongkongensis]MCG9088034.1 type II toxin-antitoxin system HipA family toxin [Laribacter hongkongensis]MCG9110596.1 type II toxin-antitoxin system HipA family toxin [Laribacter hongkongensis]MCG9122325.1 type II toxin-antitoxin system HipA family toxin [Larib